MTRIGTRSRGIRRSLIAALCTVIAFTTSNAGAAEDAPPRSLTIFAAASLTDALQKIGGEFESANGIAVKFSFAASSTLARQIESGARVDVFFSADQEWMDYLDARGLISRTTRHDLLGNRLALIAPADSAVAIRLDRNAPLLAALGRRGRLATGDPDSVPAGKYAKSGLATLHLWKDIEPRLVRAENARAALMYVARGEAPLGIVYETDARVEPRVRIVDLFPQSSHVPITYPVATTTTASAPARSFVNYLNSAPARSVWRQAGFIVLESGIGAAKDRKKER
ncbi:MAG: molybdate ABC transporter substrate-binding protein [Steroidobacter sp.]